MSDWLRPFLLPFAVLTIVATVWSLAWSSEVEAKAARAMHQAKATVESKSDDEEDAPQANLPAAVLQVNHVAVSSAADR